MAWASTRLTPDTLAEATSGGCSWLAEQAEQGRLLGTSAPLRRLAWLHLLGVIDGDDPEKWASVLEVGRGKYNALVDGLRKETNIGVLDPNVCNPLARSANNPFNKVHASDELMKEIWKDVERTFPEVEFLSCIESRKTLQRLLFHYCRSTSPGKAAPESYRQGMNELAAVLFAACKLGEMSETGWDTGESLHERLVGARHTEADTFTLFGKLMKMGLRPMFMPTGGAHVRAPAGSIGDLPSSRPLEQPDAPMSAILARCMFIFDTLVKGGDAPLRSHLKKLEIEPQVFMLRWLRLLFSREYGLEDTLLLWDGLFADAANRTQEPAAFKYPDPGHGKGAVAWREAAQCSSAMPLVDFVAAASLRAMRRDLVGCDQTDCLRRLLSARAPSCGVTAILDAARRLRQTAPTKPEGEAEGAPGAAADPQPPLSRFGSAVQAGGRPAAEAGAAGGGAVNGFTPNGGGGPRPGLNAPPRGQQLLSAVGQGAQGLWGAATQAVQKISEQLDQPPGIDAAPGSVEAWRMRALQAEQERDTIRRKANEFVTVKKKEWAAEAEQLHRALADRDEQIAERDARIAQLENWIQEAASADQGVQNVDLGDGLFD